MKMLLFGFLLWMFWPSAQAFACASCGCSVNSDMDDEKVLNPEDPASWKLDVRYDYLNQTQLRAGTGTISNSAAAAMQNYNQEVEGYTLNNYLTLIPQYDRSDWGLRLVLPFIQRSHSTNGNAAGDTSWNGASADAGGGAYTSNITGLGDIRLLSAWKNIVGIQQLNFNFGLKLASGGTHQTGTSTDTTAPGNVLVDPGLQLGTGTTDLIYGLDYNFTPRPSWNYFVQAQFQTALRPVNNYRPGDSTNLNLGLRYHGFQNLTPLLQINARWMLSDSGSAADQVSTGGTLVYLTPGLSERLGSSSSLYQMFQVPVYQFVYGVQLAPQYIFSMGYQYSI